MTPADNSRRSTREIVEALRAQLAAVKLADNVTDAFQEIERFDVESLVEAYKQLVLSKRRICILVVLDETFEPATEGGKLVITRTLPISLLISDRVLGDRVKAHWGDDADSGVPGALGLYELALPAVTGQLIDAVDDKVGVICEPLTSTAVFLQDNDRKELPGRAAVMLELRCTGGTLEARVGLGPNL